MLTVDVGKRLDGFSLDVVFTGGPGITVLFGPSGAGKSLTLQAIAGTLTPDKGRIGVDGQPLFDSAGDINVSPQRRRIGYVPQNYALFPHMTVAHNIAFGLNGLGPTQKSERLAEMVAVMGLGGLEGRRPGQLSGGQQQRVALARALAFRPRLLLLDEPFSSLDDAIRSALHQEVLAVPQRWGADVLLVTHDLDEAYTLANRIVVIDGGRILQEGGRQDVLYGPRSRRVAELVGTRNILRGVVEECRTEALILRWRGHDISGPPHSMRPGQEVSFCIRATQVMIVRPDRATHAEENQLQASIVREAISGESYVLYLRVKGSPEAQDLEVELPGYVYHRLGLDRGKEVVVTLRRSAIHIIPED